MESTSEKPAAPLAPGEQGTFVPEWELPAGDEKRKSRLSVFKVSTVPLSRPAGTWKLKMPDILRRSDASSNRRRILILGCVVAAVLIVALAIGLGVGLTRAKKSGDSGSQDLPLPGGAQTYTGDLTYYAVGLGACGITSQENQNVVAVSHTLFDAAQTGSDPNANPLCGQKIRARRYYAEVGAERSVDLTVVDRCVGCKPTDLDVSTGAFDQLAPEASGRVDVTWAWLAPAATAAA